jgi:5-methylthioadenosine/S-adenosylhomocysteine deaminase
VLHAATLGGAKALGLDHDIGSLEIGKQADLTVISLTNIAQLPVHDVHTALVFASGARDVTMTIVAGQEIYRNGRLTMVDENELTQKLLRMSSM